VEPPGNVKSKLKGVTPVFHFKILKQVTFFSRLTSKDSKFRTEVWEVGVMRTII